MVTVQLLNNGSIDELRLTEREAGGLVCPRVQQLYAMEKSTELGRRKGSRIAGSPNVCVWAHWWVVCSVVTLGEVDVVLCG